MSEAKVALVTGAGRGIGRDIALRMAREGYAVRTDRAHQVAARRNRRTDSPRPAARRSSRRPTSRKREQVLAAVETVERELGPISVLINNAGAYLRKRFTEITEEDFDFQLKVNCYGPFFCTQAVVGEMAERGAGTIIFVLGSESRSGPAQYSAYNASKLAQRAIAESVAYEFMHRGRPCGRARRRRRRRTARACASRCPTSIPSHFVSPEAICDEIVHLINQPRNAWTFRRLAIVRAMASARRGEEEGLTRRATLGA